MNGEDQLSAAHSAVQEEAGFRNGEAASSAGTDQPASSGDNASAAENGSEHGVPPKDGRAAVPDFASLIGTSLEVAIGKPPEYMQPVYSRLRQALYVVMNLLYGIDVIGEENIPASGGCIIASNHVSLFDPPLIGAAIRTRQVHFIAKKNLFDTPVLGSLLSGCGCVWVDRASKDGKSVNQAIDLLAAGRMVGIFPEGTRSKDGKLGRGKLGAAVMALKSGVPVVPACVFNTYEVGGRRGIPCGRRLCLRFGSPLEPVFEENPGPALMKSMNAKIMGAIEGLQALGPAQR